MGSIYLGLIISSAEAWEGGIEGGLSEALGDRRWETEGVGDPRNPVHRLIPNRRDRGLSLHSASSWVGRSRSEDSVGDGSVADSGGLSGRSVFVRPLKSYGLGVGTRGQQTRREARSPRRGARGTDARRRGFPPATGFPAQAELLDAPIGELPG